MPTTLWVLSIAVTGALIGTVALLVNGWSFDGAISAASWTARWSFIWFLLAWSASSLAMLWPGGWRRQLLRRRRAAGVSFAAAHVVHAGFFTTAILVFGVERPVPILVSGGLVYAVILAMAATSNDAALRRLGARRWKRLHTIGGWIVLAVFANSYIGRLIDMSATGVIGTLLIVAALGLRFAARRRCHSAAAVA